MSNPEDQTSRPQSLLVRACETVDYVAGNRTNHQFYQSPDLKAWTKLSEFGSGIGAHGGVWECPDLFPLKFENETKWILLVSINPGVRMAGQAHNILSGNLMV